MLRRCWRLCEFEFHSLLVDLLLNLRQELFPQISNLCVGLSRHAMSSSLLMAIVEIRWVHSSKATLWGVRINATWINSCRLKRSETFQWLTLGAAFVWDQFRSCSTIFDMSWLVTFSYHFALTFSAPSAPSRWSFADPCWSNHLACDQKLFLISNVLLSGWTVPPSSVTHRQNQNRSESIWVFGCPPLPATAGRPDLHPTSGSWARGHAAWVTGWGMAKLANWTWQSESTRAAKLQFESHVRKAQQTLHCFCCSGTLPQCSCASAVPTSSPSHFSAPALA